MRVLSLFNGISCGRVAIERANVNVSKYTSYEIDDFANKIAKKNYPNDEYRGDVFNATYRCGEYDLLIGGSPCTYWSIARKDGRETKAEGQGYRLFMEYVRALREEKPKYFIYENNYSISDEIKEAITKELGVEPILLKSSFVSAQERNRLYWTNINVSDLNDNGLVLKDIVLDPCEVEEKYWYKRPFVYNGDDKRVHATIDIKGMDIIKRVYNVNYKCCTLTCDGAEVIGLRKYIKMEGAEN